MTATQLKEYERMKETMRQEESEKIVDQSMNRGRTGADANDESSNAPDDDHDHSSPRKYRKSNNTTSTPSSCSSSSILEDMNTFKSMLFAPSMGVPSASTGDPQRSTSDIIAIEQAKQKTLQLRLDVAKAEREAADAEAANRKHY
jgi:hypothetical protein